MISSSGFGFIIQAQGRLSRRAFSAEFSRDSWIIVDFILRGCIRRRRRLSPALFSLRTKCGAFREFTFWRASKKETLNSTQFRGSPEVLIPRRIVSHSGSYVNHSTARTSYFMNSSFPAALLSRWTGLGTALLTWANRLRLVVRRPCVKRDETVVGGHTEAASRVALNRLVESWKRNARKNEKMKLTGEGAVTVSKSTVFIWFHCENECEALKCWNILE